MRILVCIDDTDNLESRGTGKLAALLADDMEKYGWGSGSFVTRHQLFVHPDIPYTSHNSAMCFSAEIEGTFHDRLIHYASEFLGRESAHGSDPGLCVAAIDELPSPMEIIDFGLRAKESVLAKKQAYDLARRCGIHLSEHGGTGHGVIGALAGVGLRLSGNDGRVRGKLLVEGVGGAASVRDIRSGAPVDEVRSLGGEILNDAELVRLGEKVKAVYMEGRQVLLVAPADAVVDNVSWRTCNKQELSVH